MENNEESECLKRKKGFKRKIYDHERIKNARLSGAAYINSAKKDIPAVQPSYCKCKLKCYEKVDDFKQMIWDEFHNVGSKNEQDCYLQNLMEIKPVQRRRPNPQRVDAATGMPSKQKTKDGMCKYTLNLPTGRITVCRSMFIGTHGITLQRCRRILNLLKSGKMPIDMRGRQISGNAKNGEIIATVMKHIDSFPVRTAKYTTREYKFLNERLNLKVMYKMFRMKHPDVKISYCFYRKIFKERFDLSFGRPQVDTCQQCEELIIKTKSKTLSETLKKQAETELRVHKVRARKFHNKMKSLKMNAENDSTTAIICMDYMQNLQIPEIPMQELFYMRQVTVNVFGIHNIKNERAFIFTYHEGLGGKGPNDVCSLLKYYIENYIGSEVQNLHIFADSCSAQNKNNTIVRMLLNYVDMGRFNSIHQYFPVRGHSFLGCDGDFGLLKRHIRTADRIYTVKEYIELMSKASEIPFKFTFIMVDETVPIFDFKSWWVPYYKKNVMSLESYGRNVTKDRKVYFQTSKFKQFSYMKETAGCVTAKEFIDSPINMHTFRLKSVNEVPDWPTTLAIPSGKKPINSKKIADIKKLELYIPEEHMEFYKELCNWPTTENEDEPESI